MPGLFLIYATTPDFFTDPKHGIVIYGALQGRIGKPEEDIDLTDTVKTVAELLSFLKARGEEYEAALAVPKVIRVAINHEHVEHDELIAGAREIALFHNLSRKSSQSISAMLNFLYTNHIRQPRFGFYILGTRPFPKCDYPHHYTIELIDEARGLL
jgi:molybdopterin synthase sulfur carrier subunit